MTKGRTAAGRLCKTGTPALLEACHQTPYEAMPPLPPTLLLHI